MDSRIQVPCFEGEWREADADGRSMNLALRGTVRHDVRCQSWIIDSVLLSGNIKQYLSKAAFLSISIFIIRFEIPNTHFHLFLPIARF
jgi:hypothetical protein